MIVAREFREPCFSSFFLWSRTCSPAPSECLTGSSVHFFSIPHFSSSCWMCFSYLLRDETHPLSENYCSNTNPINPDQQTDQKQKKKITGIWSGCLAWNMWPCQPHFLPNAGDINRGSCCCSGILVSSKRSPIPTGWLWSKQLMPPKWPLGHRPNLPVFSKSWPLS